MPELQTILQNTLHAAEIFLALLKEERSLLEKNKASDLEPIFSKKHALLLTLEELYEKQKNCLMAANFTPDFTGLNHWLSSLPELKRYPLISLVKKLRSLLFSCQEENKINGIIVLISQQQNDRLMALIFKQPQSLIYGSDAKTIRLPHQRSLDRA